MSDLYRETKCSHGYMARHMPHDWHVCSGGIRKKVTINYEEAESVLETLADLHVSIGFRQAARLAVNAALEMTGDAGGTPPVSRRDNPQSSEKEE